VHELGSPTVDQCEISKGKAQQIILEGSFVATERQAQAAKDYQPQSEIRWLPIHSLMGFRRPWKSENLFSLLRSPRSEVLRQMLHQRVFHDDDLVGLTMMSNALWWETTFKLISEEQLIFVRADVASSSFLTLHGPMVR
jgi:hypothetical protein